MLTPLDIVKDVYARFAQNDIDGFLNLCSDEIEWVVNGPATLKKCHAFHGLDGVREFLEILGDSWTFSAFTAKEFIAAEQTVVVLGEESGADKHSGETFVNRWAHVFDVQAGRIVRFREFLCHWPSDRTPPPMSWNTP
ncbi:MAG: nuclear transport factor 2 family protein [Gammaproteobacteria bacterium]